MSGVVKQFPVEKEYEKNPDISPEDILKLREWLKTQPHLPGDYLDELDLIISYHCCERSAEVSKQEVMLVKLKGVHFLNAPGFMDKLLLMLRPFLKKDLLDMLYIHQRDSSSTYDHIPKKAFPKNYNNDPIVQVILENKEIEVGDCDVSWISCDVHDFGGVEESRREKGEGQMGGDEPGGWLVCQDLVAYRNVTAVEGEYPGRSAFMFQAIEGASEMERVHNMTLERDKTAQCLWRYALELNVFNNSGLKHRYIMFGSMIFGLWENWDQLDGAYFCFISLSSQGSSPYFRNALLEDIEEFVKQTGRLLDFSYDDYFINHFEYLINSPNHATFDSDRVIGRMEQVTILLKPTKVLFSHKNEESGKEELRSVVAYQNPFTGDYCVHKSHPPKGYMNALPSPESTDSGVSDEYEPLKPTVGIPDSEYEKGKDYGHFNIKEHCRLASICEDNSVNKTRNWNYKEYQI
ncbi:hypothetical protein MSG28_006005 [Choristoneura fumiferana]|uniref:Uncharacterized protein n=1 Tax=Choristoneura fumiferana TaxID=7141 RepID=A0ACC0L173_CHOFU|nr:hypothetical protein MSG28_006005 [Choristoneura fumiferana]